MKRFKSKKALVFLGVIVVAIAAAIGAYAYWTASGAGSGSATAASGESNLVVAATGWADLAPNVSKPVNVTVTNPSTNPDKAYVTGVSIDDSYVSGATGSPAHGGNGITTSAAGCLSQWFSMSATSVAVGQDLAPGATSSSKLLGNVTFNDDSAVNQDACKGASITIHLLSN